MRTHRLAVIALVTLALTGCTATTTEDPAPSASASSEAPAAPERADVPWADYDPTLQTRIDDLTTTADCAALQTEFDTADANNDATVARTGHNNADLLMYIDEALELAGCY